MISSSKRAISNMKIQNTLKSPIKFLKDYSVGAFGTSLYYQGKDSHSSKLGVFVTVAVYIALFFAGFGIFSKILSREKYNLDRDAVEISYLEFKDNKLSDQLSKCQDGAADECLSISNTQIVSQFNANWLEVFLDSVDSFSCDQLTGVVFYIIEDQYYEVSHKAFGSSIDNQYICYLNVKDLMTLENSEASKFISDQSAIFKQKGDKGTILSRFYFMIKGLNQGDQLRLTVSNNIFSDEGIAQRLDYSIKVSPGEYLANTFKIVKYQHDPSILPEWISKYIYDNEENIYTTFENSYSQRRPGITADQVHLEFHFMEHGENCKRYPTKLDQGLADFGGLLGLVGLLAFIEFRHKNSFEKRVLKKVTQRQVLPHALEEGERDVPDIERKLLDNHNPNAINGSFVEDARRTTTINDDNANSEVEERSFEEIFSYETFYDLIQQNKQLMKKVDFLQQEVTEIKEKYQNH